MQRHHRGACYWQTPEVAPQKKLQVKVLRGSLINGGWRLSRVSVLQRMEPGFTLIQLRYPWMCCRNARKGTKATRKWMTRLTPAKKQSWIFGTGRTHCCNRNNCCRPKRSVNVAIGPRLCSRAARLSNWRTVPFRRLALTTGPRQRLPSRTQIYLIARHYPGIIRAIRMCMSSIWIQVHAKRCWNV